MKTTLDLPDKLVREMKLLAVMQGRTLRDLVADFLHQGLGMAPVKPPGSLPASSMVAIGGDGLPFIACQTNAPARQKNAPDLLELERQTLAQEDMLRAGHPV